MSNYSGIQKEETLKSLVHQDYFSKFGYEPNIDNMDFVVTDKKSRDDLLLPQNIREVKGSFFTPAIWADKSKEYLAAVFGADWQDEYYIWDCAAGTGNLLVGLTNKYNVWASDIDAGNIATIQSLIATDENSNLLPAHVFRFDFLNDSFDKLPEELQKIINDKEKRKKLIVYINPPYAEATSAKTVKGTWQHKAEVSTAHGAHAEYKDALGKAANELFSLFIMRIADKIPGSYLAMFSKLKYVNSSNFSRFRANFSAQFKKGFICPSFTFDNVSGKFPIGFLIWQLSYNGYDFKFPKSVKLDVFNAGGKRAAKKKGFYNKQKHINAWLKQYDANKDSIGILNYRGSDFQQQKVVYIANKGSIALTHFFICYNNLNIACIYYAVRHCITPTWLNDRDQFLYPNDGFEKDDEFKNDCLIYTLFSNNISGKYGVNHWIPFTEAEVDAKEKFESNFMNQFLVSGCRKPTAEAAAVLSAGLELWRYYHSKIKNNKTAPVNASFYDIREFFQGRKDSGAMNSKSADETYNALIGKVRDAQKTLAAKIAPKVYEYGFLRE
ncbi:MAG: hypothetical protein Pg6A_06620 [Termitinemataceae bacterium]|nr:MAG: hypothetical protein Pg6A_06620 [Termitinemataceae bacterium]